jgi:hypothetical protein
MDVWTDRPNGGSGVVLLFGDSAFLWLLFSSLFSGVSLLHLCICGTLQMRVFLHKLPGFLNSFRQRGSIHVFEEDFF